MLPDVGSHDVIGHVTIRPAVGVSCLCPIGFRDIKPQIFWGHDVIGHTTIRLAVPGCLVSYKWSVDTNPCATLIGRCKI